MWMLPGRNAAQSLSNLQGWLDSVAETHSPGCRASDGEGQFLTGHYQQMKGVEADEFLGDVSRQLDEWGGFCQSRGLSCGRFIKVSAGSGRGHMKYITIKIGPFKG